MKQTLISQVQMYLKQISLMATASNISQAAESRGIIESIKVISYFSGI